MQEIYNRHMLQICDNYTSCRHARTHTTKVVWKKNSKWLTEKKKTSSTFMTDMSKSFVCKHTYTQANPMNHMHKKQIHENYNVETRYSLVITDIEEHTHNKAMKTSVQ